MKIHRKHGAALVCFALLITVAIIMIAGCMESTQENQGQMMTPLINQQGENPAAGAVVMTRTTAAPAPLETAEPASVPDPSTTIITIDPIGDKNIGDLLVISGTTNLPKGTPIYLYWTYGNSGEEKMIANRPVFSGTNGTGRWRFAFDSSGFRPGSYKMTVATGKKDVSGSAQFSLAGTFLGPDSPTYYSGASKASGYAGTPSVTVQPVGDRQQGDIFLISGTTNPPEGTFLFSRVYPAYSEDKTKKAASSSGGFLMDNVGGDTIVLRDRGTANRWSFAMDTGGFEKIEYIVNVSTVNEDYTIREIFGTTQFTLR